MSVINKLHKLQVAVRSLATNADGSTGVSTYKYVSGNKLLGFVRPQMDGLGLILTQEIVDITNTPMTYPTKSGTKSEMFTSIHIRFTWIDVEDESKLVNEFYANGMNAWDKGLGSALTYGERYYLMKTLHLATDEDDVDALDKPEAIDTTQQQGQTQTAPTQPQQPTVEQAIAEVKAARNARELNAAWVKYKPFFEQNIDFVLSIRKNPYNPKKGRSTNK